MSDCRPLLPAIASEMGLGKLRDYQLAARNAVFREFNKGKKSTYVVLPTGCGKTVLFAAIAKDCIDRGKRVLILAHRDELLSQAAEKLEKWGIEAAIEKADRYARAVWEPSLVVASVQTLRKKRLETWPKDYFRLIVTDEAHHATARSYQDIYHHFDALHLGVTATPDRADGDEMDDVFDSMAFCYSLPQAIQAGHLSRLVFTVCDVQIDLSQIRKPRGQDYSDAELADLIRPHIEVLANATRQEIGQRKAIVFTPDVKSAEAIASALEAIKIPARPISGKDKADERRDTISRFRKGEFQALVNCDVATEGFDCPDVAAVVLCRPTKSRAKYAQMVGRGTRPADNKPDCLVVDFGWITRQHELCSFAELFDDGEMDVEVIEIADALTREGRVKDGMEAIEEARHIHEERVKERAKQREKKEQQERSRMKLGVDSKAVKYQKFTYDPFSIRDILGIPNRQLEPSDTTAMASDKQVNILSRFGVTGAEGMTRKAASRLLGTLFDRRERNMATLKQVSFLISLGVPPVEARSLNFQEASARIGQIKGN